MIEIRVHASQAVLDRLPVDTDENRLVEATAVFLIQRQRADDLPASLDLDDVAAAYDGYIDEMVAQLSTGTVADDPSRSYRGEPRLRATITG